MALIQPSIGRKVWFYPQEEDLDEGMKQFGSDYFPQPFDATIVYVHGESLVNLHVLDHEGTAWKFEKVILLPECRPEQFPVRCAAWMPYQLDQAYKAQQRSRQSADCDNARILCLAQEAACQAQARGDMKI